MAEAKAPNLDPAPKTFEEAFAEAQMNAQDKAALEGEPVVEQAASAKIPGAPEWALIPSNLGLPPGRQIAFMQFKAKHTDFPQKGDRQCILWRLTDKDESMAAKRARGDRERAIGELAKGMIRAIDGHRADWTGHPGPGDVNRFWNEIGAPYRQMILNYYFKTHALPDEEQADFFENGLAVLTVDG